MIPVSLHLCNTFLKISSCSLSFFANMKIFSAILIASAMSANIFLKVICNFSAAELVPNIKCLNHLILGPD